MPLVLCVAMVAALGPLASCSSLSAYHSQETLARRVAKLSPQGTHRDDVVQRLLEKGLSADSINTYYHGGPEPSDISSDMQALFEVPEGAEVWSYTVAHAKDVPVLYFAFPIPFPIARGAIFVFEFDAQHRLLNSAVRVDLTGP